MNKHNGSAAPAVYVQTNDATNNEVIAFGRDAGGGLESLGRFATGGRGTGQPHLPSQSSIVLSDDGSKLLVVNAGSDDLSLFTIDADGLRLADRVASGGATPLSIAVSGDLVYVLNNGAPNVTGFRIDDDRLVGLHDSTRALSAGHADPAQVAFSPDGRTLAVTERGTDSITTYAIDERGYAHGPMTISSSGKTPYGFDFTDAGAMVVTEAFGGAVGQAAASSYALGGDGRVEPVSRSIADTRSEVCWAAVTGDDRFVYVANFGDGTISSYAIGDDGSIELHDPVAGSTGRDAKGIRDEAISRDGRFLYAIDADAQKVFGWTVGERGELDPIGAFDGVPETVAGLAAS